MAQQCPLIFRQVDATVVRINTLFVVIGIIGFMITYNPLIVSFLIVDFFLRLYGYKQYSLINRGSLLIQQKLSLNVKMEDAGAKRLAAFFGLIFSVLLLGGSLVGAYAAVNIIGGVFLFCASLELFFGYCIACKLYYIAKKIYPKAFE